MNLDPQLQSRAEGCLLGQCAGDALGSMVEFEPLEDIRWMFPNGLRVIGPSPVFSTIAGQPTDDSEMALALARTLTLHGWDAEIVAGAYVDWLESKPFDIGSTTSQALTAMLRARQAGTSLAEAAEQYGNHSSEANGALMRQSPLAVWGHALPPDELAIYVRADTRLTHPNRVCEDASCAFIIALTATIRHALTAEQAYKIACAWDAAHGRSPGVTRALKDAAHTPPDYLTHKGHVLVALQNAFYQALHAPTMEEGVVRSIMGGGDTDTNAAIAGALLGAIHGRHSVPEQWQTALRECRPKFGLRNVVRPRPAEYWPDDLTTLGGLTYYLLGSGLGTAPHIVMRRDPRSTGDLIAELMAADEDQALRIVEFLLHRPTYQVLERAEHMCHSSAAGERLWGANIIGRLGHPTRIFTEARLRILLDLLTRELDPLVLEGAATNLSHFDDLRTIDPLVKLSDHESPDVRCGVGIGLDGKNDTRAIKAMIKLSADKDIFVRAQATFDLAATLFDYEHTPEVTEALVARLDDADNYTRAWAIFGLAHRKDERGVPALQSELDSPNMQDSLLGDTNFAFTIIEAVEVWADPQFCPVLQKLNDAVGGRDYIEAALKHCGCADALGKTAIMTLL